MSALLDRRARKHFEELSETDKAEAIAWLRECGFSDHGIAHATRMSVQAIRQILAERESET